MRAAFRRAVRCGLLCVLAACLFPFGCGGKADSSAAASPATTTITITTAGRSIPPPDVSDSLFLDPLVAQKHADVIVYGKITKIDRSPAYITCYVEPKEVLKGTPKWGTPVAFIVMGSVEEGTTGPVLVGDSVLVIGEDYVAKRVYDIDPNTHAYFAMNSYTGIYVETGGTLFQAQYLVDYLKSSTTTIGNYVTTVTLAALREAIEKQNRGIDSSTPTLVPLPTTTT